MRHTPPWILLIVFCARTVGEPQDADYVGGTHYRLRRVYTPDYECDKVTRNIEVSCPEPYIPWCDEITYVTTPPTPSSSDGLVTKYVCPPAVIYCKERDCKNDTTDTTETIQSTSASTQPPLPPIFLPPPIIMAPPPPPPCWCAPMAPMCPCPGPPPMPMPPMFPPPMFPPPMFPPPIFPPSIFPPPPPPPETTTKESPNGHDVRMPGLGKGGMDMFLGLPKSRFGRKDHFRRVEEGRMVPDDEDDDELVN